MKAAERVGNLKHRNIKFRELPTKAIAQSVERLRDEQKAWIRIIASVKFLFCPFAFFLLCYPGEAVVGPISTGVCII